MAKLRNSDLISVNGKWSLKTHSPRLFTKARKALALAIAPSSNFRVGAAIMTNNGRIFSGCNIESPVYLGLCAERVALFKGLSEGARTFVALAIVCEESIPLLPCGTCRQLLWEFAPDLRILVHRKGRTGAYRLSDLFPMPFERKGHGAFRNQ